MAKKNPFSSYAHLLTLFILFVLAGTISFIKAPATKQVLGTQTSLLPGQQIWKNGVSSFLFGTNNTAEASKPNIMTDPAIAQSLKDAGFTLMRTFYFDRQKYWLPADSNTNPWPKDSEIETRMRVSESTGAVCMAVIFNAGNIDFAKHLVAYLGNRCNIYEFGNEPNGGGNLYHYSADQYIKLWNSAIPQLRKINPHAAFIGPILDIQTKYASNALSYMQAFLNGVKSSKIYPDALSFHYYPCLLQMSASECLSHATDYVSYLNAIRTMTQKTLGKTLPIGITEWNAFSGGPYPSYTADATGTFEKSFFNDTLASFIANKVDFAAQFNAASGDNTSNPNPGGSSLFSVYTGNPLPQYYTMKDMIATYSPPKPTNPPYSCPVPQKLLLTPYCGGDNFTLSRVMIQWSNAISNLDANYNLEVSYNDFSSPTNGYWDNHVTGNNQKEGYAYANYPVTPTDAFDFSHHSTLYVRVTYINGACSTNTKSITASVSLSICE